MAGGERAAVPLPILALELERQSEADAGVAKPPSLHCPRPRAGLASLQTCSCLKFFFWLFCGGSLASGCRARVVKDEVKARASPRGWPGCRLAS